MKIAFFGLLALCVGACSSETSFHPRDSSPRFGDRLPGTIHVVAWQGFERPGHYHLPKGATLGLLIDVAGWKPIREDEPQYFSGLVGLEWSNFLVVTHDSGRAGVKRDRVCSKLDEKGMPYEHRNKPLLDGDVVRLSGITW